MDLHQILIASCEILWNIQHERRKSIHVWTFHRMMKLLFQLRRKVLFFSTWVTRFSRAGNFPNCAAKCKFKQMCLELWFIKSRLNNKIFHSRPHARTSFALLSERLVVGVHLWLHLGRQKKLENVNSCLIFSWVPSPGFNNEPISSHFLFRPFPPAFAKYWFTLPTGKPDNESELFSLARRSKLPSGKLHTKSLSHVPRFQNSCARKWNKYLQRFLERHRLESHAKTRKFLRKPIIT